MQRRRASPRDKRGTKGDADLFEIAGPATADLADGYPDADSLLEPPLWPVLDLYAALDVFNVNDDDQEIDVRLFDDSSERVGPRFQTVYTYAWSWM